MQKEKLKEQDNKLEEIEGLLKTSRQNNKEMSSEIDTQNPIISNLDKQMDKVDSKIKRTQNKLNKYIEQSSSTCLMTTICLQIVLLLFILLIL